MRHVKLFALALIAFLVLVLVMQNTAPVETHILFATVTAPAALLLFVTACLGFVLGVGASYLLLLRRPARTPR